MILPIKADNRGLRRPAVTVLLVIANLAAFAYMKLLGPSGFGAYTAMYGLIPFEIAHASDALTPTPIPLYATLFTAIFIHGGWLHLAGNMLYLWIFSPSIEDALGHARFVAFYLFCGAAATAAHVLAGPDSTIPMVGASGAIAGVLGAYMASFPGARIHVVVFLLFFIQVIRVPALIVLGVWFAVQLINASAEGGTAGGVAWYAHIAGFVVGYLIAARRRRRLRPATMEYYA